MGVEFGPLFSALRAVEEHSLLVNRATFDAGQFLDRARLLRDAASNLQLPTAPKLAGMVSSLESLHGSGKGRLPLEFAVAFASDARARFLPAEGEDPAGAHQRLMALMGGQTPRRRPTSYVDVSGGSATPPQPGLVTRMQRLVERALSGDSGTPEPAERRPAPTRPASIHLQPYADAKTGFLAITPDDASELRVERQIGRGAFGDVLLATDTGFDRNVAVKVIRLPAEQRDAKMMLTAIEREFRLQGGLMAGSEHVVQIYHRGVTAQGQPFVTLEYLPDGTAREGLDRLYQESRLPSPGEALHWMTEAAGGLWEAHQREIIHRDFKPENLFLRRRDGSTVLKLADFGGARTLDEIRTETASTADGTMNIIIGTPGYMPPLTLQGHPPTRNDDVFAWGVFAYELLTGQVPWDGPDPASILQAMLNQPEVALPSHIRPDAGIPPFLERIVLKALRFRQTPEDPVEVYGDAGELLFDLMMIRPVELEAQAMPLLDRVLQEREMHQVTRRQLRNQAIDHLRSAILFAEEAFEKIPDDRIRNWIVRVSTLLNQVAEEAGNEPVMHANARRVRALAPESSSATIVSRNPRFVIFLDGQLPTGAEPRLAIFTGRDQDGLLRPGGKIREKEASVTGAAMVFDDLPQGPLYVRLVDPFASIQPIQIPLPPFRSRNAEGHLIRIPVVPAEAVPAGWTIVPAGPAVAAIGEGSYAEVTEPGDYRWTDEDIAVGPLVDQGSWYQYVEDVYGRAGNKAALSLVPTNWSQRGRTRIDQGMGMPTEGELGIHSDTPVSHVTAQAGLEYGAWLVEQGQLSRPPRYLTLGEFKRWWQGVDRRPRPHGETTPNGSSTYSMRINGFDAPPAIRPNTFEIDGRRIWDISPFTVYLDDGTLVGSPWAATNVQIFHRPTDNEWPRLADLLKKPESVLRKRTIIGGVHFGMPEPKSFNIVDDQPTTYRGPVGVRLVLPLGQAQPTPTLESLTGKS